MIFLICYITITFIFSYFFKRKYGAWINPHNLFTWLWTLCASIATFIEQWGMRHVQDRVHIYSIIFIVIFNIVCLSFRIDKISNLHHTATHDYKLKSIWQRMLLFELIALALYGRYFLLSFAALLAREAETIRMGIYYAQEGTFFTRTVAGSVLSAIAYLSLYLYYQTNKKTFIYNSLFIVLVKTITSMGRHEILSFVIVNILLSVFQKRKALIQNRYIFGAFIILVLVTSVRGAQLGRSMITYFSGSFAFLDYIISNPADYGLGELHYGMITFSPITEPLLYFLKGIHLTTAKIPSYWLNVNIQEFVDIGDSSHVMYYNNNTTALLPFLLDFGVIGIPIGAITLAIFSNLFYKGFTQNEPVQSAAYIYVLSGLFSLTMSYQSFMGVTPFIVVLTFYMIMRKTIIMNLPSKSMKRYE